MKLRNFHIILIALFSCLIVLPLEDLQSQTVMDRFSRRYLKKNRVKRFGKKMAKQGKNLLEDMAVLDQYEIIGFEPSWMIKQGNFGEHYFNLISTLVVGEYDINPVTGAMRNPESFNAQFERKVRDKTAKKEFNILQRADYHNPKLNFLLHVTYYGDYGREVMQRRYVNNFLKSQEIQQSLKDSLQDYFLTLRNDYGIFGFEKTGILLDFQIENNFYNLDFVDFVKYLREQLGEDYLIYLKIPAKYRKDALLPLSFITEVEPYVNKFVVQGYGFEKYAGSSYSPTVNFDKTSSYSIDGTIRNYMIPGFEKTVQEKFIIELPYYGVIFRKGPDGRYSLKDGNPYITVENFNDNVRGRSGELSYRNDNMLAYYLEGDSLAYLMEDSTSLASKYIYIRDSLNLNGFALNALGYYTTPLEKRHEAWAAIADNDFAKKREKMGWVIAYYLTAFIPIGFVFSIFRYWQVRNALAKFSNYWTRFRLFFLLFVLIFLVCTGFLPRYIIVIIGLIIMAAFFIYIMIKKALMRSKKYVNIVK